MTKPEFIKKYAYRLGGMVLFMQAGEVKAEGVLSRTQRVFEMPAEIETLLGAMFDDLKRLTPDPAANGQPSTGVKKS